MNWKGYLFCLIMLLLAATAWFRPGAAAAQLPTPKYAYQLIPATDAKTTLTQLNDAGAQGWHAVGLVCLSGTAGPSGFGCEPETLLEKSAQ
jgi:hypothetical protein